MLLAVANAFAVDRAVPGAYATIEDAIAAASAGDRIVIAAGTFTEGDLNVDRDLTFVGAGATSTIVSGGTGGTLFYVAPGVTVVLEDVGFTTSNARRCLYVDGADVVARRVRVYGCGVLADSGGGVYASGGSTLALEDATFESNVGASGAHVSFRGASLDVDRSTFASGTGAAEGAIAFDGGVLAIRDAAFLGNGAGTHGGALALSDGSATIERTTFDANLAPSGNGGAIYAVGADELTVLDATFTGNSALRAAAIDATDVPSLEVRRTVFCENDGGASGAGGGAVRLDGTGWGGRYTWSNNVFHGNGVVTAGGAIFVYEGRVRLERHTFVSHGANGLGGTLHVAGLTSDVAVENSLVLDTSGGYGAYVGALVPAFSSAHDAWWSNLPGDWSGPVAFWPGTNDLYVDPQLQRWTGDCASDQLWPAIGSPLVDAGTGLDLDGSTADIGAWGGPEPLCALADYWFDADGDGYGDPALPTRDCAPPAGHAPNGWDCDDGDATVGPETTWFADDDGDGHGDPLDALPACVAPVGRVADATDCDDGNANVHDGAAEICDGLDDDCDGTVPPNELDPDGDGAGACAGDCAPLDPTLHPGDDDVDGVSPCDGDCDDAEPAVHPGAPERCDQRDDDCDGQIDEEVVYDLWYLDADGDGYGAGDPVEDCAPPADGYTIVPGDCDDAADDVHPDATERCDGRDDDCDAAIDEGCPGTAPAVDRASATPRLAGRDPGCACASGAPPALLLPVAGALLLLRRRKR